MLYFCLFEFLDFANLFSLFVCSHFIKSRFYNYFLMSLKSINYFLPDWFGQCDLFFDEALDRLSISTIGSFILGMNIGFQSVGRSTGIWKALSSLVNLFYCFECWLNGFAEDKWIPEGIGIFVGMTTLRSSFAWNGCFVGIWIRKELQVFLFLEFILWDSFVESIVCYSEIWVSCLLMLAYMNSSTLWIFF